ncbi:FAD-binding protein [Rhodobacterales bacterium HKCCE3408]|nr:FAD-binding protein [Rhodobacterales bacterium HKCCE3408]
MTLHPGTETELAHMIREAGGPLAVRGGGTRSPGASGEALSTAGLRGVTLYEPGALTIVARAGTPLSEIRDTLAAHGQHLPFEPPEMGGLLGGSGTSTIGGVVATNASGPRRIQAGACRDSLIGVRFVDGTGAVVKNGGRVMKNVTGYDLAKLMAGSHGTLGVLTEVSFKVLPAPAVEAGLVIEGLDDASAQKAMAAALGSPFEVTGAAHLPGDTPRTLLRIGGLADSVAYRSGRLKDLMAPFGPVTIVTDADAVADDWRRIRDVAPFAGRTGDVWRISVRPSDGPQVAGRSGGDVFYDWGGGLIWALVPEGTDLRAAIGDIRGHATLIRASADTRDRLGTFHPEPAGVATLTAGLRAKFDPRGILNAGVMA